MAIAAASSPGASRRTRVVVGSVLRTFRMTLAPLAGLLTSMMLPGCSPLIVDSCSSTAVISPVIAAFGARPETSSSTAMRSRLPQRPRSSAVTSSSSVRIAISDPAACSESSAANSISAETSAVGAAETS